MNSPFLLIGLAEDFCAPAMPSLVVPCYRVYREPKGITCA